jgi:hypothetical protein
MPLTLVALVIAGVLFTLDLLTAPKFEGEGQ